MATPELLDQWGEPVQRSALTAEEAAPAIAGVRNIWAGHPARGLTPTRLVQILTEAEFNDPVRYLEVAEEMEEKDLHYLSTLNTRKNAIVRQPLSVEAASDDPNDQQIADDVRKLIAREGLADDLFDIMDAVGKGYSVTEIMWEMSETQWYPRRFVLRDPRWFRFDRVSGTVLNLFDGSYDGQPLSPFKFIRHVSKAKSGLTVRGGLARAIVWMYLFKNFGLKGWMSLAEVYGVPWRIGKYDPGATDDEKRKLLAAVANLASDAAAIMPKSMLVDIVESAKGVSGDLHSSLLDYVDRQISKAVLGQTLTSDVGTGGSGSRALGEVHNEVRGDIRSADASRLEETLARDFIRPYVDLNYGPQKNGYPKLKVGLPDPISTMELVTALGTLIPVGLQVSQKSVLDRLGIAQPAKGDALLVALAGASPALPSTADVTNAPQRARHAAQSDVTTDQQDALQLLATRAIEDSGWKLLVEPIVDPIKALFSEVTTLEELRDRLVTLMPDASAAEAQLLKSLATAHVAGRVGADANGSGSVVA
jgi:phage gp29-like protein